MKKLLAVQFTDEDRKQNLNFRDVVKIEDWKVHIAYDADKQKDVGLWVQNFKMEIEGRYRTDFQVVSLTQYINRDVKTVPEEAAKTFTIEDMEKAFYAGANDSDQIGFEDFIKTIICK